MVLFARLKCPRCPNTVVDSVVSGPTCQRMRFRARPLRLQARPVAQGAEGLGPRRATEKMRRKTVQRRVKWNRWQQSAAATPESGL